jgi:hypothetical protein
LDFLPGDEEKTLQDRNGSGERDSDMKKGTADGAAIPLEHGQRPEVPTVPGELRASPLER